MFVLWSWELFVSFDYLVHGDLALEQFEDVIAFLVDGFGVVYVAILLFTEFGEVGLQFLFLVLHLFYPLVSLDQLLRYLVGFLVLRKLRIIQRICIGIWNVPGYCVWLYLIIDEFILRVVLNMIFLFHNYMHRTQDI